MSHVAQNWGARHVVGVDIDADLVSAAWHKRLSAWSLQASLDLAADNERPTARSDHFASTFESIHGPLPIPSAQTWTPGAFPHNLTFRTADWLNERIPDDDEGYDVVLA
jgi:7SK snRNA methylphosphate capping enzyme